MCTHTMVANEGGAGKPDRFICCDCCREVVPKRTAGFKLKPSLGQTRSKHEPWDCAKCGHAFELGDAWFDPTKGITCPKCLNKAVGPSYSG
jgi:DNA-directed RNA polymerase subunit RPC12/RpoP